MTDVRRILLDVQEIFEEMGVQDNLSPFVAIGDDESLSLFIEEAMDWEPSWNHTLPLKMLTKEGLRKQLLDHHGIWFAIRNAQDIIRSNLMDRRMHNDYDIITTEFEQAWLDSEAYIKRYTKLGVPFNLL